MSGTGVVEAEIGSVGLTRMAAAAHATPTFATASVTVPFVPATNRIVMEFIGSDGVVFSATSVAVLSA